ncbi:MAG: TraX family protein [Acetanaerobacterium sp.]
MQNNNYTMSGFALKAIAVAAMFIDHAAYLLVDPVSPAGLILHFIGRLTAPIMCYFIAEGFYHTHSIRRYAARLAVFAVISQIPFQLVIEKGDVSFPPRTLNMLFTLLCGLLALWAWKKIQTPPLSALAVTGLCAVTLFSDWQIFGVLFILGFGIFHGDRREQLTAFAWISAAKVIMNLLSAASAGQSLLPVLSTLGIFCAIPLILLYNGQRGGENAGNRGKRLGWLFYIAYPAHLLVYGVCYILFFI